jgi:hypothetical protein
MEPLKLRLHHSYQNIFNLLTETATSMFLPCAPLTPNFNIQEWRTYSCLGLFFQNGHVVGITNQNFNHWEDRWDQGFYFSPPNFVILKVWQNFQRNFLKKEFMLESCKFPKKSQFSEKQEQKMLKKKLDGILFKITVNAILSQHEHIC